MCDSMYNKLFMFREKMLLENQKKRNIEGMDNVTASMANTVDHMQRIYPGSTLSYQKKANKLLREKAQNNSLKIVSLMDGRRESHREQSEIKIHNEKYPSSQRD